jgi:hypothetical protein
VVGWSVAVGDTVGVGLCASVGLLVDGSVAVWRTGFAVAEAVGVKVAVAVA